MRILQDLLSGKTYHQTRLIDRHISEYRKRWVGPVFDVNPFLLPFLDRFFIFVHRSIRMTMNVVLFDWKDSPIRADEAKSESTRQSIASLSVFYTAKACDVLPLVQGSKLSRTDLVRNAQDVFAWSANDDRFYRRLIRFRGQDKIIAELGSQVLDSLLLTSSWRSANESPTRDELYKRLYDVCEEIGGRLQWALLVRE